MYTWNPGGYPDARDGIFFGIGALGALTYVPDLGPVGSGSQGTYYPRDTSGDARALNFLGYFPEPWASAHVGTRGSQSADMNAGTGAWSHYFQEAVKDFQQASGLSVDGWIGPGTRRALAAAVLAKNAQELPIPPSPGPIPIPPSPNVLPGPTPGPTPPRPVVAEEEGMPLWQKIAIGVGAVALVGGAAYALSE